MKNLDTKQRIKLAVILMESLNTGDWEELFALTDCTEFPKNHDRFFQDVHWGNDSLKQGCILAVNYILDKGSSNLKEMWELNGVKLALKRKEKELYDVIESCVEGSEVVSTPTLSHINQSVFKALEDAEVLLKSRGAVSAYDRMHTAFHGFLKQVCKSNGITSDKSDSITALLPKINDFIKKMPDIGRNEKVYAMLRSSNSILDTLNYFRNNHSLSHPNEYLLTESDAMFSINLARSIMSYIDELLD